MSVEIWAAIIASITGVIVYAAKKYVDLKVNEARGWQIELIKKRHLTHFDIIEKIEGMLAEIDHCIDHIRRGDMDYKQNCKEWCMKVRQESRASVEYIGEDILNKITIATDIAIQYSNQSSTDLYNLWQSLYLEAKRCAKDSIKNL